MVNEDIGVLFFANGRGTCKDQSHDFTAFIPMKNKLIFTDFERPYL